MTIKPEIPSELPKAYEPAAVEQKWYQYWEAEGYFTPKIDPDKKPFVIIQPPPNITGDLHLGHALTATLEDIMVRWHRMLGEPTLWLPGEDHAGIAAQVVVERALAKEGLKREQIGREKFTERMWQWVNGCRANISNQHRRLGVSCDWTRERFTLDEGPSRAVRTYFVNLFNQGLIYRGERITNWCPRCATALSDLEVEHEDVPSHLWYIKYPIADEPGRTLTVATTRPETMLGDTAVAVNPDDPRYHDVLGKAVVLPLTGRIIPIVADESVAVDFGTGAVKVTPAHDPVDFETAQRHKLPLINILNPDCTINEHGGRYLGMDRLAARKAVVEDLEKEGLLEKTEPYTHSVGHCQRCRTIIEPTASRQWFVHIEPLAKPAIAAVKDGAITIVPERFSKVYLNWMENIRDWCISRQLWWGHRIPVWYCGGCGEMVAAVDTPYTCPKCGSDELVQDPDVLDTWFSSGLWTHSTLGWPDRTEDLEYFYPTTVMETAYDILFFWVARMIMAGLHNMGEIPFRYVYLHGLIRDERGDKMSKTKGNVLDPLVLMDKYGTDALRFAIIWGTSPGNDSKLAPTKLEAGRNFANKLWNATRFVMRGLDTTVDLKIDHQKLTLEDRWIISRLNRTIASVEELMRQFEFGEALRQMHDFLWGEFCDWYIELVKGRLQSGSAPSPLPVLVHVLDASLKLLHPFMPFVTEELWQSLRQATGAQWADSIMIADYPWANEQAFDPEAERVVDGLAEVVRAIRNARVEYEVAPEKAIEAHIYAGVLSKDFQPYTGAIETLAKASVTIEASHGGKTAPRSLVLVQKEAEVVIPLASMFDLEAELQRVDKEKAEAEREQARLGTHLNDETFLARAPEAVVAKEKERLAIVLERLARLKEHRARLQA